MDKIINSIKRALLKVLPNNRELNGDAFQRGRQSLAIEIADIIDPISNDNLKPNNDINNGEVLYKQRFAARAMVRDFGLNAGYALGFIREQDSIILGSIPWEESFDGCEYEVSVRKIGKIQIPEGEEKPQVRRRAKQQKNMFFDFYANANINLDANEL